MKEIIFDIEADGLDPNIIHCIVAKPLGEPMVSFKPNQIEEGIKYLQEADCLIGHNLLGFDIPVIKKLYNIDLSEYCKLKDTLVMSRLYNPVRENGHSLKTWGYIVNMPKQEHEEWDIYSPEMLKRCKQDVIINEKTYEYLLKEGEKFSKESLQIEHEVFNILKQQESNGFLFDLKKATLLVASLRERMLIVQKEVRDKFKPRWVDV